jgi:hypothetical protein
LDGRKESEVGDGKCEIFGREGEGGKLKIMERGERKAFGEGTRKKKKWNEDSDC